MEAEKEYDALFPGVSRLFNGDFFRSVIIILLCLLVTFGQFVHYGSILWHDVGKNPILVGYVVLGIGYGVSAHDLSGYKVLGVLVVDNGPHVKEPLTALLKPIPKS